MPDTSKTALGLSRTLLRALIVLNLAIGAAVVLCFVASFVLEEAVATYYRTRAMDAALLIPALRIWMVLGVPFIGAVHVLLSRLLAITETVRTGHPFVPDNAGRLRTAAWCLLVMELLHLSFGVFAGIAQAANADVDWRFSITGWLAVLLLFVLARVFEEGTRIHDELEAVV